MKKWKKRKTIQIRMEWIEKSGGKIIQGVSFDSEKNFFAKAKIKWYESYNWLYAGIGRSQILLQRVQYGKNILKWRRMNGWKTKRIVFCGLFLQQMAVWLFWPLHWEIDLGKGKRNRKILLMMMTMMMIQWSVPCWCNYIISISIWNCLYFFLLRVCVCMSANGFGHRTR